MLQDVPKDCHMQIYTALSVVEPRRLLVSTGKNEGLYALVLVSHIII